ncbi:MAG: hypothetical protein KC613_13405 [Myxococcales bacterium]|nr:hypothetical protein [Myxococcales bacterium]
MDDAPDDLTVRAQYALWLTDHGEPADWRAELRAWAERSTPASTAAFRCEACGFTGAHAWVICARCDGLETLQVVPAPAEGLPVVGVGARLADLQVLALRGR